MTVKKQSYFKKIAVFVTLAVVVPAFILFSADTSTQKKILVKGATTTIVQGISLSWKNVNTTPLDQRETPRTYRAVLNFERALPGGIKDIKPDTAVQLSYNDKEPGLPREMRLADLIIEFPGLDKATWGAGWPPDPTGDVGVNYFIQAVNTSFGIFNKTGGPPVYATTFNDFFHSLPSPCGNYNNGDPIVLYDRYNSRWVIMDFAWLPSETDGSWFSIAASKTSDPTGDWWLYAFRADNNYMNDYPKMGVWSDGIYITANMFTFPGSYLGVRTWAIKIPEIYNGTLISQTVFDNSTPAWTILPANAKGPNPPPDSPCILINADANEWGAGHSDKLVIWEYDVDWVTPGNTTWSVLAQLPVTPYGLTGNQIPQRGTATTLDALYGRAMFPAIYRVFDGFAAIYLNHLAEYGGRRTKRWYEVRIAGGTPSIYQQSTYAPPDSHHRWNGSMAADEDGNIALGYSISSSTLYPSIRYAARASIDPNLSVLSLGEGTIKDGTGYQSYFRWGDYSTMTIDPVDDQTFWYTNEYMATSGLNWQTSIGAFKLKPDLWSKDSPDDPGDEPNTTTVDFWLSEDMWVRNQADGFTNQEHQNPEYGQTNYLYVRVRCREGEGSGLVKTYWSYAGTGMWWPDSWEAIGSQYTGTIQNGNDEILEFPWDPPDPSAYGPLPFCLWSRIETAPQSPYGMAFPEIPSFWDNVVNNNNIIWKNFTIVDNIPNGQNKAMGIFVGNPTPEATTVKLVFRSPDLKNTAAKTSTTGKNVLQWGTIKVDLGNRLYSKWQNSKGLTKGVAADTTMARTIKVSEANAQIEGITFEPGEKHLIKVIFTPFKKSAADKNQYYFDVIQYNFDGKAFKQTGGVRFVVKPPKN